MAAILTSGMTADQKIHAVACDADPVAPAVLSLLCREYGGARVLAWVRRGVQVEHGLGDMPRAEVESLERGLTEALRRRDLDPPGSPFSE